MASNEKDAADQYDEAIAAYGAALQRLVRAYEADPERRRDLLQEIHIALWRSLAGFDRRCSLRTWVYRVAHNTATSQVIRRRARAPTFVSLDDVDSMAVNVDREAAVDEQRVMERLVGLGESGDVADDAYETYWRNLAGLKARAEKAKSSPSWPRMRLPYSARVSG